MRLCRLLLVFLLLAAIASFAQSSSPRPTDAGLTSTVDKSVDPCVDFYQYACGNWIKNSEIPPDQGQWGSFMELRDHNLEVERGILEKAEVGGASRDPIDQKIGDLYGSCMDEKNVNEKGVLAVKPELDRIAAVQDKPSLIDEIAHVHLAGSGSLFQFYPSPDYTTPTR